MADNTNNLTNIESDLLNELSQLIEQTQQQVSIQINSSLTLLFWNIGNRINQNILQNERAEYGKQIVVTVARQLTQKYGRNFEEKNLRRMLQFAKQFSDFEKVVPLARQLSWSHFLILLPLKNYDAKIFYAQKAFNETLGKRELRNQIALKAFERTGIADAQTADSDKIPLSTFKDPYVLDFLGLQNTFLEKDLEQAILFELEKFILELGKGFTFVERQKRMIIDGEDFNLDLLFYHRKLKRLVAIELKLGKSKPSTKDKWSYT